MKRSLAVLATAALVAACSAGPGDPEARPAATKAAARCDPGLDAALRGWEKAGFSGSVAISTRGEFVCLAGYGAADRARGVPVTPATVFSIGSVTKAFTAASIFALADAGKLSTDDRAGELLPGLKGPAAKVTVGQLLLHTSGLNGSHGADYRPLDRDSAVAAIGRLKPAFRPGTGYVYSNAGYTLLALIVDRVSGTGYRRYTASRTLRLPGGAVAGGFWNGEPAAPGPRAVGYLADGTTGQAGDFAGPHWALDGNGGLAMTARDLAAWTYALFSGRLVSPESTKAIGTPGHDLGDDMSETPGWVAYGKPIYGTPVLTSSGGGGDVGHNAVVAWLPERGQVIAIASNGPKVSAGELLRAVGPAMAAGEPLPPPGAPAGDTKPTGDAAIVGRYELDTGGSFDVTATDGRTTISARGADAVAALFPPRGDVPAGDLRDHERRVLALLGGTTREGRAERAGVEGALGPITGITLGGTTAVDGEPRTYVTVTSAKRSLTGWYSVNEEGGVQAAQIPAGPPALTLVPAGGGSYRPDDPAGTGPEVTLEFGRGRVTVSGPAGDTGARRPGG
ncbi:serine hydrolase [Sphaerisporangium sp. TRM90804]|uniref:serine hydrolase domain-containing protein n=1 Tax=Sphaerisporangium sp. TRM90804 TaxID=3031113 RepID=UPI00244A4ACC|nr:serine hydrolase [Sphaerisporangium sp. TRM90804]MDH2428305.1 serine hydrolase [Sphaerisporangium sp. TRM90804]